MSKIQLQVNCPDCKATGLYVGMAERDGAAIVCGKCKGTGCYQFAYEYEEFAGRKDRPGVRRVYEANPGIGIGEVAERGIGLDDFGGIAVEDWLRGEPFPPGSEMREFSCPAWWYQTTDYARKPEWKTCGEGLGGPFYSCPHFDHKCLCWARFDEEEGEKDG
jgi:hypothetical protein